ncbi:hypothetical protein BKA62DRAFT_713033 [Auriculariales sp. MPI-PUGE-AT-0066]|nr:hypothetical protein BKA62DRAFT_713033 [Auriculariales sp. MPI-PUGE-AT-0066]
MLILTALAYFVYYGALAYTYLTLLWRRGDQYPSQPSAPPADPNDPAASAGGGSWSWLGALFSPIGDSAITVLDRTPPLSFEARPASFGRKITEDEGALVGYLIPLDAFAASPDEGNACEGTRVRDGYTIPEESESWIALVQRGGCGFSNKVLTAQNFGARAVVVGNSEPDLDAGERDTLVQMYAPGNSGVNVTIPSTFVTFATHTRLLHLINHSNTTTSGYRTLSLAMLPEMGGWEWYSPVLTFLALLLLPSLLTLLTLVLHRVRVARARRADRAPEDVVFALPWRVWGERGLLGDGDDTADGVEKPDDSAAAGGMSVVGSEGTVPPANVASTSRTASPTRTDPARVLLPASPSSINRPLDLEANERTPLVAASTSRMVTDFTRAGPPPSWFASQTQCAICLGDFERGDRVRILPCRHVFHLDEVDAWLIGRKKVCPICKSDVTAHLRALQAAQEPGWKRALRRAWNAIPTLPVPFDDEPPPAQADAEAGLHATSGASAAGYGAAGTTSRTPASDHTSPPQSQPRDDEERWLSISERLARREARETAAREGRTVRPGEADARQQEQAAEEWAHGDGGDEQRHNGHESRDGGGHQDHDHGPGHQHEQRETTNERHGGAS